MPLPSTEPASPSGLNSFPTIDQDGLVYRLIHRIRQSLDLQDILNATAAEIQAFVGMDRIKIYKFHADGSGEVIAESLGQRQTLPSLLGLNFPADDIPEQARRLFVEARVRNVVDVASRQIGQSRLRDPETGRKIEEPITYRPLDDCHAEYLTTMGVKSSFGAPILYDDQLWGLIVGHHSEAREISADQLHGIQLVVEQLSLAIAQAMLLTQAQEKAAREAITNRINYLLNGLSTIELQSALEATVEALSGVGGRLFMRENAFEYEPGQTECIATSVGQLYICGSQPVMHERANPQQMEQYQGWKEHFNSAGYQPWTTSEFNPEMCQPWAIEDIAKVGNLRTLQSAFRSAQIRSLLIVPLQARQQIIGYLSIFRAAIETETLWAGEFDPDNRQELPRQSFDIWRQTKTGQTQPWTTHNVEWANTIGQYFATAIEKTILNQQIQAFNTTLEQQVQARTAELKQTLNDLQKTQTHLIQAEKMSSLGQLVAGVAHEINNPVNFIHGNLVHIHGYFQDLLNLAQLHKCRPLPETKIAELLETLDLEFIAEDLPKTLSSMQFGTERIREIVLSLRNFSRLDQAEIKSVDIHEGIDSTLMILQHRLKASGHLPEIQLIKNYGNLPWVECYAGSLNQVLMNLISNAIDAVEAVPTQAETPRDNWIPAITIQTELIAASPASESPVTEGDITPAYVAIRIIDNGQGMTEETHQKLFNPFFTTKPVGKGTGLGLSISYQIVAEKHHGTLTCDSTLNQGTTFQIQIPLQQTLNPVKPA